MFKFIKDLFKRLSDKEAKSLYNQLSDEFISYINSDTKNSKLFWNTVTNEELDIIRYEYICDSLIKNHLRYKQHDEFLKFFKNYQNPEYQLFLSEFNLGGGGSLIEVCIESKNIDYLFRNIEKFRSVRTKYFNEDLEYNFWNRTIIDSYDSQVLNYLYIKFKYNETKARNILEKG